LRLKKLINLLPHHHNNRHKKRYKSEYISLLHKHKDFRQFILLTLPGNDARGKTTLQTYPMQTPEEIMMMRKGLKVLTIWFSAFTFLFASIASVNAGVVSNATIIANEQSNVSRAQLLQWLSRDDVAKQMSALGVNRADVESRINVMTPEELAQFNQQADQLPAGSGVIGIIVLFFVIFIITDIIGATDIFPFIHPVSH